MRPRAKLSFLAAAAAAILALTPNAAYAAGEHDHTSIVNQPSGRTWYCANGNTYVSACFAPQGEWFKLRDNEDDGYSVVIQWQLRDIYGNLVRYGQIWATYGADFFTYTNKSFGEDKYVLFRGCRGNHSNNHEVFLTTCTDWKQVGTG